MEECGKFVRRYRHQLYLQHEYMKSVQQPKKKQSHGGRRLLPTLMQEIAILAEHAAEFTDCLSSTSDQLGDMILYDGFTDALLALMWEDANIDLALNSSQLVHLLAQYAVRHECQHPSMQQYLAKVLQCYVTGFAKSDHPTKQVICCAYLGELLSGECVGGTSITTKCQSTSGSLRPGSTSGTLVALGVAVCPLVNRILTTTQHPWVIRAAAYLAIVLTDVANEV